MSEGDKVWADAVSAWVPLAKLLTTVETKLGIPGDRAAEALRPALESYQIDAAVVSWREPPTNARAGATRWAHRGPEDGPSIMFVSSEGWMHVDWKAGTLADCEIRIRWAHVVRELASLSGNGSGNLTVRTPGGVQSRGGPPTKHDWDAFWIAVTLFASANDLFDVQRTKMQQHITQWAEKNMSDPVPDPSTIRRKIGRLYEELERARK